jgi:hypothetical protein
MNNTQRMLLAFSAIGVSLGAAIPAFCSDADPIHVSVPFAFTAGKTNLPAGDYTVYEENTHVIMLKGDHGSAILIAAPGSEENDKAGLSFQHTDKGYFLKAVHSFGRPSSLLPVTGPALERQ